MICWALDTEWCRRGSGGGGVNALPVPHYMVDPISRQQFSVLTAFSGESPVLTALIQMLMCLSRKLPERDCAW